MKPLPHHYEVHLMGGPAGYAQVSSAGLPELRTAPPADYGGPGDAWSPEHLLLVSAQTCLLFTLSCGRASVEGGTSPLAKTDPLLLARSDPD
jgi:organic hydroperoxide reductase OsmC/OhrA